MNAEFPQIPRVLRTTALSFALVAGLASCTSDTNETSVNNGGDTFYVPPVDTGESSVSSLLEESKTRMDCYVRSSGFEDCDQDGTINSDDVLPTRIDTADDDGDGIANNRDRWHGWDDKTVDSDGDGIADYLDTFFGNNFDDADGDGVSNDIDVQPYAAPPAGTPAPQPPSNSNNEELKRVILKDQMKRKYTKDLLDNPDTDYDGIPDDIDTSRTEFTNDRDGDGDYDFYDPEPRDYFVDSRNDPYDPRNNEYWERD